METRRAKRACRRGTAASTGAASSSPMPQEPSELLRPLVELALSRTRARCQHLTEYSHAPLADWVCRALGDGWEVHAPTSFDDSPAAAWPGEAHAASAARALRAVLPRPLRLAAEDMLEGHCEQMAAALTRAAAELWADDDTAARAAHRAATLADEAQAVLRARLLGRSAAAATELVFGAQRRAGWRAGPELWRAAMPELCPVELCPAGLDELAHTHGFAYGAAEAAERLRAAGARAARGGGRLALPLYVIAYIFDADELPDAELGCAEDETLDETAQYSVHAVGVLLDGDARRAVLADPNGSLLRGGSMEFVAMPPRPSGRAPTTACSHFDAEQRRVTSS